MERLVVVISRAMGVVAALAIVVLMAAIVTDVTTRYITGGSMPAMVELSESALVVAVFFGLAWAGASGAHVAVSLVTDRLPDGVNRILTVVVWLLATGFTAWMTFATYERAVSSTDRSETRMGLVEWPIWPLRWVIVIGLAAFLLVCVINLLRAVRGREILPAAIEGAEPRTPAAHIDDRAGL
ncbi:TRAP transporter small permease [Nesterenkonia sp. MY13]|uniref:TRAP transporter small permease n=1 Tax=Nesterenkonia sedimenti TaxID=1463632 RepID=A0A7X8TKY2_9MICC|nr:TRAP transporter small permease [Nesterenkonia sedimenti]NLS10700.1 TRAP transporter small permease [Nesterenkonia sedimenti]